MNPKVRLAIVLLVIAVAALALSLSLTKQEPKLPEMPAGSNPRTEDDPERVPEGFYDGMKNTPQ
jgi:hypothetical protein